MSDNPEDNQNQSFPSSSDAQTPDTAEAQQETEAAPSSQSKAGEEKTEVSLKKSENPAEKVEILLKPVGDAPIMKQKKWKLDAQQSIGYVINWVRRYLKMQREETLFFYVNQAFAPAPDQSLKNLYECFGAEGKLVLHYSKVQAWG